MRYSVPLVTIAFLLVGCAKPARPQAEVDRSLTALATALESWKANEPPAKLKALSEPIEFSEDLRKSFELESFQVGSLMDIDPKYVQVKATLKLKNKKGKTEDREVVYQIQLGSPIRVLHDPYY